MTLDEPSMKRLAVELSAVMAAQAKADEDARPSRLMNSDWFRWLIGVVAAAVVAYFTTISAIRDQIAAVTNTENGHYQQLKATEEGNFGEVIRRIQSMADDIRDLRSDRNGNNR